MTTTTSTAPKSAKPASTPAKADRPSPGSKAALTTTSPKCMCGCGERTQRASALYIPGHDARHAGQVARQIAGYEGGKPTGKPVNAATRDKALNSLPSTLLRNKAADHADRLMLADRLRAARTKAEADRKAAVEAARKVA